MYNQRSLCKLVIQLFTIENVVRARSIASSKLNVVQQAAHSVRHGREKLEHLGFKLRLAPSVKASENGF